MPDSMPRIRMGIGPCHVDIPCCPHGLRKPDSVQQRVDVITVLARPFLRQSSLGGSAKVRSGDVEIPLAHSGGGMAQERRHRDEVCPATEPSDRKDMSEIVLAKI